MVEYLLQTLVLAIFCYWCQHGFNFCGFKFCGFIVLLILEDKYLGFYGSLPLFSFILAGVVATRNFTSGRSSVPWSLPD